MHELPFIILARRGDDDGNQEQEQQLKQEPGQDVLHDAGRVRAMCKDLVVGSTANRQMYTHI